MWLLVAQRIAFDFLWHLVYFPIWWCTGGVKHAALYCWGLFNSGNEYLAPGIWLKNIFVPMFGQTDWQGRIMSVFMRIVNIIIRSLMLFVWMVVVFVIFSLWFIWPVFLIYLFGKAL